MRTRALSISVVLVLGGLLYADPALSGDYRVQVEHRVELGVYGGLYLSSPNHELYDYQLRKYTQLRLHNADLGLRFAWYPVDFLGAELEGGIMPSATRATDGKAAAPALIWVFRGHAAAHLPHDLIRSPVSPMITVGLGRVGIRSAPEVLGRDADSMFHYGLGLRIRVPSSAVIRLEGRHWIGASSGISTRAGGHWEVLLGFTAVLHRAGGEPVARAPKNVKGPRDRDKDGIADRDDDCPREYAKTPDGCPIRDKDGDGILDEEDTCPERAGPGPSGCPLDDIDGDGVIGAEDRCPDVPAPAVTKGCPRDADRDGDGIADFEDDCMDLAEDKDGWDDRDGCPDEDNDGDGLWDEEDDCPDRAEILNGVDDEDGCPDESRVELMTDSAGVSRIVILDKIYFETGSAVIKRESLPILDDVATVLKTYPGIDKLEVQGHTDDVGNFNSNMRLSQERAESVVSYLTGVGIEESRLKPAGYGSTEPLEPNTDSESRSRNRRVEFVILTDGGAE